jgi:uncharacterized membrane protein
MPPRPVLARIAALAAVAALLVGYQLLAHRITVSANAALLGALWATAPLAVLLLWLAWRARRPGPMVALWLALVATLGHYWPVIQRHPDWIYFGQHLAINCLLMLSMGLTLRPGRQPLCSRLATRVRGPLTPQVAAYTRRVTAAWTLFFGLVAVTSALLFWLAPIEAWSVFANLLTAPLVLLMFLGEYAARFLALPPEQRSGPLEAIRAYWSYGQGSLGDEGQRDPGGEPRATAPDREPPQPQPRSRSLDPV